MIQGTYMREAFKIDEGVCTGSKHVQDLFKIVYDPYPSPGEGDPDLVWFKRMQAELIGMQQTKYIPMKIDKQVVY